MFLMTFIHFTEWKGQKTVHLMHLENAIKRIRVSIEKQVIIITEDMERCLNINSCNAISR